jgi:hypothetical protein
MRVCESVGELADLSMWQRIEANCCYTYTYIDVAAAAVLLLLTLMMLLLLMMKVMKMMLLMVLLLLQSLATIEVMAFTLRVATLDQFLPFW